MGFLRGIGSFFVGSFFARQAKTKTGKLMLSVALTSAVGSIPAVGEQLSPAVDQVLNGVPLVPTLIATAAGMFLRDGKAKEGK